MTPVFFLSLLPVFVKNSYPHSVGSFGSKVAGYPYIPRPDNDILNFYGIQDFLAAVLVMGSLAFVIFVFWINRPRKIRC